MNSIHTRLRLLSAAAILALLGSRLAADVIATRNGARLVGTVTSIAEGAVHLKTDYAGDLVVKQSEVTSITTDGAVAVRLNSGSVLQGKVSTEGDRVHVAGSDGDISAPVGSIAASWPAGSEDPQTAALRRHWSYEAAVDIAGKTGNKEQLGTSASVRATLKTPQDTLQFYSAYDRQMSDGAIAADQFKAGVDYQNNFAGKMSWYARDEGGFDRVKDIDLYNVAGAGIGYDFIKEPKHTLTGRVGLSYRYESYGNPAVERVSSAGLDTGINHEWQLANSKIVNRLAFVPSFQDFANYRLTHESFYELPLADPRWKLRLGVSNDYNSKPSPGFERLDTTYFTRLVLIWQ